MFYKKFKEEKLLNPFIIYLDMKTLCPIQVMDLSYQIDYKTPKKIRQLEEYETALEHTILFVILIKHRKTTTVEDGNKITGI